MTNHQTAPTQYVEANGIRFAYRRFGKADAAPLIFNMHFMGTMDHWDPAVTDGFAKEREVILFDNAGVSSSSGHVPGSFAEMGANAIAFIKALGLKQVDVLGFSIGGLVAQEITLQAPHLVRRLVLVGTGPRSGDSMDTGTPEGNQIFGATYEHPDDLWLRVHFTPSESSQAAGRKFLKRFRLRTKDRDPEVTEKAALAQRTAIAQMGRKTRTRLGLFERHQTADSGRQRQQRRHHLYDQLVHPGAESAERSADHLSRFSARLSVPISRTVRPSRLDVPLGGRSLGAMSILGHQTAKPTIMPSLLGNAHATENPHAGTRSIRAPLASASAPACWCRPAWPRIRSGPVPPRPWHTGCMLRNGISATKR